MSLRIIGGTLGGRRLAAPPGLDTRPLPDRIKQSLFDWLGQDLSQLAVADVCAGSGSFGFEAVSRGAGTVHLVEPGPHAAPALAANLRTCGHPPQVIWHRQPFQAVLPTLTDLDLVFADPPFPWFSREPQLLATLLALARDCLAQEGTLLLRGERGHEPPALPSGLRERERRHYGRSWVGALARC